MTIMNIKLGKFFTAIMCKKQEVSRVRKEVKRFADCDDDETCSSAQGKVKLGHPFANISLRNFQKPFSNAEEFLFY